MTATRSSVSSQVEAEPIDAPLRVTAPHEWAVAGGLLLLVVLAVAWGVFGRVAVNVTADGVLVRPGERRAIVSAVSGLVTDVLVEAGDVVAADALVAVIEPAGVDARLRVAATTEALLADLIAESDAAVGAALREALVRARAEHLELTALQAAGSTIVSSRAGQITATHVEVGDVVDAGTAVADVRHDSAGPVTAMAVLPARQAREVQAGMTARVRMERADGGEAPVLAGTVTTVSAAGRLPAWLRAAPLPAGDGRGLLIEVAVDGREAFPVHDFQPCRLEIVLRRVAPLALLRSPQDVP